MLDKIYTERRRPALDEADISDNISIYTCEDKIENLGKFDVLHAQILGLGHKKVLMLLLRDWQGLDYETISQILNIPLGTVKSRFSRMKVKLGKVLKPEADW